MKHKKIISRVTAVIVFLVVIGCMAGVLNCFAASNNDYSDIYTDELVFMDDEMANLFIAFIYNVNTEEVVDKDEAMTDIFNYLTGRLTPGTDEYRIAQATFVCTASVLTEKHLDKCVAGYDYALNNLISLLEKRVGNETNPANDLANSEMKKIEKRFAKILYYIDGYYDNELTMTIDSCLSGYNSVIGIKNKLQNIIAGVKEAGFLLVTLTNYEAGSAYDFYTQYVSFRPNGSWVLELQLDSFGLDRIGTIDGLNKMFAKLGHKKAWNDKDTQRVLRTFGEFTYHSINEQKAIPSTDENVDGSYSKGLKFISNGDGTCYVNGIGSCKDTDISIPPTSPSGDRVTSIGHSAFYACHSLTSVVIPEGVTSIGAKAFYFCSKLTNVDIPKSVTSIGGYAFCHCGRLESIVIPEGVMIIDFDAFAYCTRLTSIVIPESVTKIGSSAFYECSNMTSIVIPKSVTRIHMMAFGNCFILKDIYFFGSKNDWKAIYDPYGNNFMSNTTIHYLGEWEEVTVYPTCTDKGYTYFKCNCGRTHNYSETNPLGHDKISHEAKDPTCTDIGWNAYETCSRCDYTNYKEIPAPGHTYTAYAYNSTLHWLACKNCGKKPETADNEPHKLTWTVVDNTNEDENKLSCTLRAECKCGYGSEEPFITGTAKITGVSLALGEKLTLKYYAILPADDMNVVMRFTYEDETYDVRGIKDTGTGEYVFSFDRIPPSKMDVAVKAELVLTQNDTETILAVKEEYSISEYCEDAKEANPEDEALNLLLDDLETYNKAAEDYENGISKDPSDVDWEPLTDTDFSLSESTDETVRFKAAGVRFGFVNRLFFKFTADDLNGLTVKVNDTLYTESDFTLVEGTENTYIIYSEGINATEFDKVFTVVLHENGEEIQTLKYSVKSYVEAKQDDPEMGALVRSLYNYGKSSELYRDEM